MKITILRLVPVVLMLSVQLAHASTSGSLIEAAKRGDRALVRETLNRAEDVNAAEKDGMTALHWAVYNDQPDVVEMLLAAGARPNAKNRTGMTPLQLASESGNPAIVERLIRGGADPNLVGSGETALHVAAYSGHLEAAKILIANHASVDAREAWYSETPLMLAASQNHSDMVAYLIQAGAEIAAASRVTNLLIGPGDQNSSYTQTPKGGLTALSFAARDGCNACVQLLMGAGADVNYEDPAWITPLNLAVYNGHLDIAASLLEHGANPNDDSLYLAVELRNLGRYRNGGEVRPNPRLQGPEDPLRLIRLLLDKGADPNGGLTREIQSRSNSFQRMSSITGLTTLQRAAQSLDIEVMKLLLDRGADPNRLTMAAEANLDGPDWGGHLALLSAVGGFGAFARDLAYRRVEPRDQGEAVKLLLDRGAQVNATNFAGMTALHLAAQSGSNALVQLLVDHGARLDLKDFWDRTPLDAAGGGHQGLDGFSSARPARPETQALLRRLAGAAPAATATSGRDSKSENSDQGPLR